MDATQTSTWTAAGVWVAALSFLGLLVRQINPWRAQTATAEQSFRE
jgi:hypothetical protein